MSYQTWDLLYKTVPSHQHVSALCIKKDGDWFRPHYGANPRLRVALFSACFLSFLFICNEGVWCFFENDSLDEASDCKVLSNWELHHLCCWVDNFSIKKWNAAFHQHLSSSLLLFVCIESDFPYQTAHGNLAKRYPCSNAIAW